MGQIKKLINNSPQLANVNSGGGFLIFVHKKVFDAEYFKLISCTTDEVEE